jgi:hypothetical protein
VKRRSASPVLSLAIGFAMFAAPLTAHHGSAGYDYSVPRKTLQGTVSQFEWQNPHAQIFLDVKDDKGRVATWALELNNPGNLVELGWTHTAVKVGDQITVTFNPGKQDRRIGICVDALLANGQKLHSSQGCVHGNLRFDEKKQLDK